MRLSTSLAEVVAMMDRAVVGAVEHFVLVFVEDVVAAVAVAAAVGEFVSRMAVTVALRHR